MSAGLSACVPLLERVTTEANPSAACQSESVVLQQIRGLLQRVFLPGWPLPAHQVVFSAADEYSDAGLLCIQAAKLLARESSLKVCIVEGNLHQPTLEQSFGGTCSGGAASGPAWCPAPGPPRDRAPDTQELQATRIEICPSSCPPKDPLVRRYCLSHLTPDSTPSKGRGL